MHLGLNVRTASRSEICNENVVKGLKNFTWISEFKVILLDAMSHRMVLSDKPGILTNTYNKTKYVKYQQHGNLCSHLLA